MDAITAETETAKNKGFSRFRGYFAGGAIEVPFTNAIPCDYYGCMGVPLTALDKISFGPDCSYELLSRINPIVNGKKLYRRLIIRKRLPPEVNDYLASGGYVYRDGDDMYVPLIAD